MMAYVCARENFAYLSSSAKVLVPVKSTIPWFNKYDFGVVITTDSQVYRDSN